MLQFCSRPRKKSAHQFAKLLAGLLRVWSASIRSERSSQSQSESEQIVDTLQQLGTGFSELQNADLQHVPKKKVSQILLRRIPPRYASLRIWFHQQKVIDMERVNNLFLPGKFLAI